MGGGVGGGWAEHLGEADGRVVPGVGEDTEDNAVIRTVAKRRRFRGASDLVALGFVVAERVGAQAPLRGVSPGRLVVRDALGRQQQRGHRVHDRGIQGADMAGEQRVPTAQRQGPAGAIERSPVVQLEAGEAEAGHSCSSPSSSAAYSASLASKSASHWPSTNAFRMRRTSYTCSELFAGRRKPSSTALLMCASIWSVSRASLLVAGRNTRAVSVICSRVSISLVSPPWASNSAIFFSRSASSSLTLKDRPRPGISR